MPPKAKFTKKEIIDAALQIARTRGMEAITARDVAAQLGVSTRPIFTYFSTMEEVRREVYASAERLYGERIARGLQNRRPFLGVGVEYLRFAQEEPQLYRILFLTRRRMRTRARLRRCEARRTRCARPSCANTK